VVLLLLGLHVVHGVVVAARPVEQLRLPVEVEVSKLTGILVEGWLMHGLVHLRRRTCLVIDLLEQTFLASLLKGRVIKNSVDRFDNERVFGALPHQVVLLLVVLGRATSGVEDALA